MPVYIIVDGLIAAGKTSLLKTLEESFTNSISITEPVDHWKETGNLQRFYKALTIEDPENRSAQIYRFQTYVFQSRIKKVLEDINKPAEYYFIERSIFSDRYIFMQMLYESGMVTESDYEMYKTWWELWDKVLPFKPDLFIYLNPSTTECMRRHAVRNRSGETIDNEYQENLKKRHDEYFGEYVDINGKKIPCLNLNTDVDFRQGDGREYVMNIVKKFIKDNNSQKARIIRNLHGC